MVLVVKAEAVWLSALTMDVYLCILVSVWCDRKPTAVNSVAPMQAARAMQAVACSRLIHMQPHLPEERVSGCGRDFLVRCPLFFGEI